MCSSLVSKGSENSRAMGSLPFPRNFLGLQWSLRRVLLSVVPGPGPHWLTVTPDLTCILNADSREVRVQTSCGSGLVRLVAQKR